MTRQTRRASLIEACCNTVAGFFLSLALFYWLMPRLGYPVPLGHCVLVTLAFTALSIARNYTVRRFAQTIQDLYRHRFGWRK